MPLPEETMILPVLLLLTNCNCSLWEETIGDNDSLCVTVTGQLSLCSVRKDNWLVILILSVLQLLTICHFALWEKTIGWWYEYTLCYSYQPIVSEERQLVGDTATFYVTVTDQSSLRFVRKWYWYSLCLVIDQLSLHSERKDNWFGDTNTLYVTAPDQLPLRSVRKDKWLVILILMLQLLTNSHLAL